MKDKSSQIFERTLVEKKTCLARILQDNHEKCKSCKILAEKANFARLLQKSQILQDSYRKVISCKNLARFVFFPNQGTNESSNSPSSQREVVRGT